MQKRAKRPTAETEEIRVQRRRERWRAYYYRNREHLIAKAVDYIATHPERAREINNRAKRRYYDRRCYDGVRESVIERDGRRCCHCGATELLVVHHRDGASFARSENPNNSPENLVTLCCGCHTRHHKALKAGRPSPVPVAMPRS